MNIVKGKKTPAVFKACLIAMRLGDMLIGITRPPVITAWGDPVVGTPGIFARDQVFS